MRYRITCQSIPVQMEMKYIIVIISKYTVCIDAFPSEWG